MRRGSERYWTSPAHDSLVVDDVRGKWNWHSRDKWGDAADWLVYWRNIPIKQAHEISGEIWAKTLQSHVTLSHDIVTAACANLHNPNMWPAVAYLEKRGISMQTAIDYHLGYRRGKIVIPNYSITGELLGIRYRLIRDWTDPETSRIVRYFSEKGSRAWMPYGLWKLPPNGGYIVFATEGEFKSLIVSQMGFHSIDYKGTSFPLAQELKLWDRVVFLRDTRDLGGIVIANRVKKAVRRIEIVRMPKPYKAIDDFYIDDRQACKEFLDRIAIGG